MRLSTTLSPLRQVLTNLLIVAMLCSSVVVGQSQERGERQQRGSSQRTGSSERSTTEEIRENTFVTYADGEHAVCRDGATEETQLFQRDPEQFREMRTITRAERQEVLQNSGTQFQVEGATGLTITLRATTQLNNYPLAKAAFIRAAAQWEAKIKNPISVVIDVDFGPTRFGTTYPSGVLGSTSTPSYAVPYDQLRTKLVASASKASEVTLYNALPSGSVNTDLGAVGTTSVVSPLMRAFGFLPADADPASNTAVPSIGFNSGFTYDFDPSDGITAGAIDFDAVAVHEMGHALGFTSNAGWYELSPSSTRTLTAWDLFRFRPGTTSATFTTAARVLSSGGDQRFFDGTPELGCSTGRPNGTGGDGRQASHWKADELSGVYIGIMDPTLSAGQRKTMTNNDLEVLESIGYTVSGTVPTPCSLSLSASNASFTTAASTGSVNVTASATTCTWTAASNAAWITVTSGASGTGSGTIKFSVAANTDSSRSGTLTIAGQTFTVNQSGCAYTLTYSANSFSATAATGSIGVTASSTACPWTAVSNAPWITITAGASGKGNGAVSFAVAANTSTSPRTGSISIAGYTFNIAQAGVVTCSYSIPNFGKTFQAGGGYVFFPVLTSSTCTWKVTSSVPWITVNPTQNITGSAYVVLMIAPRLEKGSRTGTVTIAGQTFTITQAGL